MAASPQLTIADIQAKAQALAEKVAANPVTASDKKAIVSHAKELDTLVGHLIPHINTAQVAFGGQEEAINQATQLQNKLRKVIAAYS